MGKSGAERIAAERQRQVDAEGYDRKHDEQHDDGAIAMAAACYAAPKRVFVCCEFAAGVSFGSDKRPHDGNVAVPEKATIAERIRLLEKAGALCAAEIDRLQRKLDRRQRKDS